MLPEWNFLPNTIPCSSGRTSEAVIALLFVCCLRGSWPDCPSAPPPHPQRHFPSFLSLVAEDLFCLGLLRDSYLGVVVVLCMWVEGDDPGTSCSISLSPSSLDSINFAPVGIFNYTSLCYYFSGQLWELH